MDSVSRSLCPCLYSHNWFNVRICEIRETTRIPVTSTPATNFINRFTKIAQTEQKKFGIPASIKLAQALLETTKGTSKLFRNHNNAFGIKCFSKTCKVDHCTNLSDDHHKDFFRIYDNAWESFRDHSIKLQGNRYKHLLSIPTTYYKAWAKGLQKAGYATDKRYTVNFFFPALLCNSLVPASRLTAIL
ncbi:MAG: glucosaminidase domain-containing protein [Bacteroidetes bacterium]|nr:glucosaminidase domain-containing protein [Bacteroidota bacterium]